MSKAKRVRAEEIARQEHASELAKAADAARDGESDAALAVLTGEMAACARAIEYCLEHAQRPPDQYDLQTRFHIMDMAIKLMDASGALGKAVARIKGEMRQRITVDRYEHGNAHGARVDSLSTRRLKVRRKNAITAHNEGEGEGPESEKQPGE